MIFSRLFFIFCFCLLLLLTMTSTATREWYLLIFAVSKQTFTCLEVAFISTWICNPYVETLIQMSATLCWKTIFPKVLRKIGRRLLRIKICKRECDLNLLRVLKLLLKNKIATILLLWLKCRVQEEHFTICF